MKSQWQERISFILATRAQGFVLLLALLMVFGGIAVKFDLPTACIIVGAVLLIDAAVESWRGGPN